MLCTWPPLNDAAPMLKAPLRSVNSKSVVALPARAVDELARINMPVSVQRVMEQLL